MNSTDCKAILSEKNIQQRREGSVQNKSNDLKRQTAEHCSAELVDEEAVKEIAPPKQRETIEILNIELLVPQGDCSKDVLKNLSSIPVVEEVKVGPEILCTDVEEINSGSKTNETEEVPSLTGPSSLSLLAQYDSDTDSVIEVPIAPDQDYRNNVIEIDSNSESDSSTTDSSDIGCFNNLRKTIEKRIEVYDDAEEDEDDNDSKKRHQKKLKVKGEISLEDLPPIQELQITVPEDECIEFGKIYSIVDQLILVTPLPNSILINLETVIFLEKGKKVLGEVFDVLGQVADPLYCVRFNSNEQIKEKNFNVGDVVYVAPKSQYTQYVILSNLMKLKGSDASWENDVEPPPRFLDYSDDEQEQLAKRQLRNKDRPNDNEDPGKKPKAADGGDDAVSKRCNNPNAHKNQIKENRNRRGGSVGYSNANNNNNRPRNNRPGLNHERPSTHHRGSWHSNYYPQYFSSNNDSSYEMRLMQTHPQASQSYPTNVPGYAMYPSHNMPFHTRQPSQFGAPSTFYQHAPRHVLQQQQYMSNPPPPPPGSQ